MSNNKYSESDPERTLITLDQLSQTIEVMTSVVNRLRQHLSEQVAARKAQEQQERERQERKAQKAPVQQQKQARDEELQAAERRQQEAQEQQAREVQELQQELQAMHSDQEDRESFVVEISQPEAEAQPKSTKILH